MISLHMKVELASTITKDDTPGGQSESRARKASGKTALVIIVIPEETDLPWKRKTRKETLRVTSIALNFLILLYVLNGVRYDRFHENYANIFRIATKIDAQGRHLEAAVFLRSSDWLWSSSF